MKMIRINIASCVIIFCLSFSFILFSIKVYAQTPQEIARKALGSVVLLVMNDDRGQPISLGSGFFVQNNVIATNLHVIEGSSGGYAKLISQKEKYEIEGIVGIDHLHDLVLLKLNISQNAHLGLGNSESVEVGEQVYAVGNPHGLEGTFSQGIVSSIRKIGKDKVFQITAPISPGSSGGPVLNSRGELIGVAVATFKSGQNLNFAIPSTYLAPLINNLKPVTPIQRKKASQKHRSILSDYGGRSTEGVIATQFTWNYSVATGSYSFSVRNQLRESINNIYCLVVFYDCEGTPIDIDLVQHGGIIPPGLAKRFKSHVDGSVQRLTTHDGSRTPTSKVIIRILDFQIVN